MCLTTKQFGDWRDVQAAFETYKTSLGPFAADELLDYLAIEYPVRPPFSRGDVHNIARLPNAYAWAPIESSPVGEGLVLGTTNGDSLRLAVVGYQFPEADDPEQRDSWYMVEGSATKGGQAWDFRWQALTCDVAGLLCGWFFDVANWVESGSGDVAPAAPWLIEPCLQFPEVTWTNGQAILTVELGLEFRPAAAKRERRGAGKPEVLRLTATADDLRRAAINLAATIARYPLASGASKAVFG